MRASVAWSVAGAAIGAAVGIAAGVAAVHRETRERMTESARAARTRMHEQAADARARMDQARQDALDRAEGWRERSNQSIERALLQAAERRDDSLDDLDDLDHADSGSNASPEVSSAESSLAESDPEADASVGPRGSAPAV